LSLLRADGVGGNKTSCLNDSGLLSLFPFSVLSMSVPRCLGYTERMKHTTATLDRLVEPIVRIFTPEVARALIKLRADRQVQARLADLADKRYQGKLTSEEREEYETSIRFANYLAILQAKARKLLKGGRRG